VNVRLKNSYGKTIELCASGLTYLRYKELARQENAGYEIHERPYKESLDIAIAHILNNAYKTDKVLKELEKLQSEIANYKDLTEEKQQELESKIEKLSNKAIDTSDGLNQLILIVVSMISTAESSKRPAETIAKDIDLSWLDFNSENGQKVFGLIQSLLPQQNKSVTQKKTKVSKK